MDVHIRNIDAAVWHQIRVEAVRQGVTVAQLIESLWKTRKA